ncbi:MAG: hypothetical protein ACLFSB_12245 [Chitinispirillaceae bacterium]
MAIDNVNPTGADPVYRPRHEVETETRREGEARQKEQTEPAPRRQTETDAGGAVDLSA